MYPLLKQSVKGCYPFRVAAPSFIYPADYITNAQRLAPFLDEIELLIFESIPESQLTDREIDQLNRLASQHRISYNVHLPLDIDPGSRSTRQRRMAVELLPEILNKIEALAPTTCTLHLPFDAQDADDIDAVTRWQERTVQNLDTILSLSGTNPQSLSIETLDYPPWLFEPIVEQLNMGVCVDVGHLLRYGYNLEKVLSRFDDRITILHLHGVMDGVDHLDLSNLDPYAMSVVRRFLSRFTGSVSLEVFSFERLAASVSHLANALTPFETRAVSHRKE